MITTVDIVLLTLIEERLYVALLKRERAPFQGELALPGGYIHPEEDADTEVAAQRVLKSKTGIESPYLEQLYTFSGRTRDPRDWSLSVAYYALVSVEHLMAHGESCELMPVDALPKLAFDHNEIVSFAVERVRNKSTYSTLPCYLLPTKFTLTELQRTYEQVLGAPLNKASFRRKVETWDFLEEVPGEVLATGGKLAQAYRIKPARRLTVFNRTVRDA